MKVNIAKLLNVQYDSSTGRLFLKMEVLDPVWKQKFLKEWQDLDITLTIEEKSADMPVYEYMCEQCEKKFEELQHSYEEKLVECPECSGKLKRLISWSTSKVNYSDSKEQYKKEIEPEVKKIAQKIKDGDEDAAADIFGEK
jgi:putative FmdB family regulatory protein